jgi:hypothetical protein
MTNAPMATLRIIILSKRIRLFYHAQGSGNQELEYGLRQADP